MASKIPPDYTHNGLNYQEWQAEGRAWYVKHGKMDGWPNKFWVRPDGEEIELYSTKRATGPKKTPNEVVAVGGHMKPRKTKTRKNFQAGRAELEEVPERLRSRFNTDAEFEEYKRYVRTGNTRNQRLSKQAGELGTKFNKGHIAALGAGGSHDPMAQRLESEMGNKSTQNIAEIPQDRLATTGTPRNWDEAVTLYQNPEMVPTELTPQDKQRIWAGENPDVVYGQRQRQIDVNPLARPNPNRVQMLQPTVSNGSIRVRRKQAAMGTAAGLVGIGWLGTPASAYETHVRKSISDETKNPIDQFQTAVSGVSLAADAFGPKGEFVSTPADMLNEGIDDTRTLLSDPVEYLKNKAADVVGNPLMNPLDMVKMAMPGTQENNAVLGVVNGSINWFHKQWDNHYLNEDKEEESPISVGFAEGGF